jgi:hypothetical protein
VKYSVEILSSAKKQLGKIDRNQRPRLYPHETTPYPFADPAATT